MAHDATQSLSCCPSRPSSALRPLRACLLVAVGLLTTVGCGRTDLGDFETFEEVAHDVEAAREVVLEDERVVYVELISPAPSRARSDLMGLSNGVSLDELIASVCPEGAPTVELDATSGTMMVYEYGGLRAIITL